MIQKCTFERGYFGRSYRKHAKIRSKSVKSWDLNIPSTLKTVVRKNLHIYRWHFQYHLPTLFCMVIKGYITIKYFFNSIYVSEFYCFFWMLVFERGLMPWPCFFLVLLGTNFLIGFDFVMLLMVLNVEILNLCQSQSKWCRAARIRLFQVIRFDFERETLTAWQAMPLHITPVFSC